MIPKYVCDADSSGQPLRGPCPNADPADGARDELRVIDASVEAFGKAREAFGYEADWKIRLGETEAGSRVVLFYDPRSQDAAAVERAMRAAFCETECREKAWPPEEQKKNPLAVYKEMLVARLPLNYGRRLRGR
jgi:hypothetical protein